MRPTSDKSDTPEDHEHSPLPAAARESPSGDKACDASSASQLRQEKLARIRDAIQAGDYDSDEVLEQTLARMLQKFENEPNPRKSGQ